MCSVGYSVRNSIMDFCIALETFGVECNYYHFDGIKQYFVIYLLLSTQFWLSVQCFHLQNLDSECLESNTDTCFLWPDRGYRDRENAADNSFT